MNPPPRFATWLAGLRVRPEEREYLLGDLVEEFHRVVVPALGESAARRWYWRQALRCLVRGVGTRSSTGNVRARRGYSRTVFLGRAPQEAVCRPSVATSCSPGG